MARPRRKGVDFLAYLAVRLVVCLAQMMTVEQSYAFARGLADRLVDLADVRKAARDLAAEIAGSAPLAVRSIRETMRGHLADEVARITRREDAEQIRLRSTEDFAEGGRASLERRAPDFKGR